MGTFSMVENTSVFLSCLHQVGTEINSIDALNHRRSRLDVDPIRDPKLPIRPGAPTVSSAIVQLLVVD
jgi:hypothetical protein